MPGQDSQLNGGSRWVTLFEESEDYRFGGLFRVLRARLRYRRSDGRMSEPVTRISFERGDSVGVLLFDPHEDQVVLVRQFRYPVYAGLGPEARAGDGARQAWLLEIVAGMQDEGLTALQTAHKELLEEAGYVSSGPLKPVANLYASPGGSSERIQIFLGEVKSAAPGGREGGIAQEGEDTEVVVLPVGRALAMVARGEIQDAKTVVALQHLALERARGQEAERTAER
jgi:ADP-ribose pyrophosphatase